MVTLEKSKKICDVLNSIEQMYDEYDLSKWSLFAGGFINFGYWKDLLVEKGKEISKNKRLESEKQLYRKTLERLDIGQQDNLLEVASGLGLGAALALTEFSPKLVKGIDCSEAQVKRANVLNAKLLQGSKNLSFTTGAAECIPCKDHSFHKIFSIEAIQHFSSIDAFFSESYRILKPHGKIAIACFFANKDTTGSSVEIQKMIKTAQDGLDRFIPISKLDHTMECAGFINIKIESIGKYVWYYFDQWISQTEFKDTWNRNWYQAFQNGLMDYYIVTAEKPQK